MLALLHEARHIETGHLWANAAALALHALHWFNPIAYLAYRTFREDQELACDAAVIGGATPSLRADYGTALVKSAAPGRPRETPAPACPMARTSTLKRRLSMIKSHRKMRLAFARQAFAVALVGTAGSFLTANGVAAAPEAKTERIVIKRMAGEDGRRLADTEIEKRCGGDRQAFDTGAATDQDGKKVRTRIMLCDKDGAAGGDKLAALKKARARIAGSTDIEPANREKVIAAIDEAIAKLGSN